MEKQPEKKYMNFLKKLKNQFWKNSELNWNGKLK